MRINNNYIKLEFTYNRNYKQRGYYAQEKIKHYKRKCYGVYGEIRLIFNHCV